MLSSSPVAFWRAAAGTHSWASPHTPVPLLAAGSAEGHLQNEECHRPEQHSHPSSLQSCQIASPDCIPHRQLAHLPWPAAEKGKQNLDCLRSSGSSRYKGSDLPPLLLWGTTRSALRSAWAPHTGEGQGAAGVSPQEGHEGNQRDRALPLWLRELPRSAQRREGSGEILQRPSST